MDLYFNEVFKVTEDAMDQYGAFNISLVVDLPLFIDPFLLFNSKKPKYKELHSAIIEYLAFLRDRSVAQNISDGLLRQWFCFSEVRQNWLGFCAGGNDGRGLGIDFARALSSNLSALFSDFGNENITKGSHLEKLCLIKEGVGRDTISDFATNLIKAYLAEYTQAFAIAYIKPELRRKFAVQRATFNYETESWMPGIYDLPAFNGDFVLLTPKEILTKDETWINKEDFFREFDDIPTAIQNEPLRAQINQYFRVLREI